MHSDLLLLFIISFICMIRAQECGDAIHTDAEVCQEAGTCRSTNDVINCTVVNFMGAEDGLLTYCEAMNEICQLDYCESTKICLTTAAMSAPSDEENCLFFFEYGRVVTYQYKVNDGITYECYIFELCNVDCSDYFSTPNAIPTNMSTSMAIPPLQFRGFHTFAFVGVRTVLWFF